MYKRRRSLRGMHLRNPRKGPFAGFAEYLFERDYEGDQYSDPQWYKQGLEMVELLSHTKNPETVIVYFQDIAWDLESFVMFVIKAVKKGVISKDMAFELVGLGTLTGGWST